MKPAAHYVHRNLNRDCWSVLLRGKLERHASSVWLRDATFVVRPGGAARARRERRRNVHAFVKGAETTARLGFIHRIRVATRQFGPPRFVIYHPFEGPGSFFDRSTGEPVTQARLVYLTPGGEVMAWDAS